MIFPSLLSLMFTSESGILALKHVSRILRYCRDVLCWPKNVVKGCVMPQLGQPLTTFFWPAEYKNFPLLVSYFQANKMDRKAGLTFNTSQEYLRILLKCFRARMPARSLYPFCWRRPHHSFSITDDSQIKRAEWRFKQIRLGKARKHWKLHYSASRV